VIAVVIWLFFLVGKGAREEDTKRSVAAENVSRVVTAIACTLLPMIILYWHFPEMDKVVWILCSMIGPLYYILITPRYGSILWILLSTPRYWCGVIAQFFYVGVQIAAWTWLNVYCQKELGVDAATGALYYTIGIVLFIVCRWVSTFLMKYFNPALMMAVFSVGAILSCLGVMYLPTKVLFICGCMPFSANIICLVAMSGFMSLMFPTIYGIALGGLDQKALKLGASGLIMAILGGAIITPWMAGIIGNAQSVWCKLVPGFATEWDTDLQLTQMSLRASFVVPAICFAVVLAYSLIFSKKSGSKNNS
jgi:FHS family L-fucose permease-like MFS transporter